MVSIAIPAGGAGKLIMSRACKIFDRVFKNYDNLNASVQENVSAIRVVKSVCPRGLREREVHQSLRESVSASSSTRRAV